MTLLRQARQISRKRWFLAAVLLIAGLAAWPLFSQAGLLNTRGGGDSPFLLQRLQQFEIALIGGHFPVRWMADANYGFGYPFYNYYAPLSIAIAAVFRLAGFGYVTALKLAQLAGFLTAAWAMFALGRRWLGSNWAGLLAATAYSLAPFHIANVYVRGDSLAEFWAMAFYPLVLLAADSLLRPATASRSIGRTSRLKAAGVLALAFAALILSHNISALIFTPFLLLFLLVKAWTRSRSIRPASAYLSTAGSYLLPAVLALILALGLSAWFWLPALSEQSLAQLEPVTSGYFSYTNHFRGLDLVQSSFLVNYDVGGGVAFRMGLIQTLLVAGGALVLMIKGSHGSDQDGQVRKPIPISMRLFILGGLLLSTFMITPLSRPLWDHLPLLAFTQFPWRFLSVQAFFGALAVGGLALLPGRRIIGPIIILLLAFSALANLPLDFLYLNDTDVTVERLAEYEWFTGNIGSTVSAEYLPETVQPRPYSSSWLNSGDRDGVSSPDGLLVAAELLERQATKQTWRLDAGPTAAVVTFPTLYWPGWQAAVDEKPAEIEPAPGSGLIMLDLPAGEHLVTLQLGSTPVRLVSTLAGLAALLVTIWILRPIRLTRPSRRTIASIALLIVLVLTLHLWPDGQLPAGDLTWDFAQMAYLHHDRQGVPFENGAHLLGYRYSQDEIQAGQELAISLNWDRRPSGEAVLALTSPAVNRFKAVPEVVAQSLPLAAGEVTYRLVIPDNAPAGRYLPRLTLSEAKALTPSGLPRGDLFLRPILITDIVQPADPEARSLDVRTEHVEQRDAAVLDVQLQWLTMQALSQNYNFSLRLVDALGNELARQDGQPGYGFQPSSGWEAGQWIDDWLALPLPDALPRAGWAVPLGLVGRLYEVENGQTVLTRRLGELDWQDDSLVFRPTEPTFTLPAELTPAEAVFGDAIALRGFNLEEDGAQGFLTLYWEALAPGQEDYWRFVHLVDAGGGIVAQHDTMPRNNSYPTGQWVDGEMVADFLHLDLEELPPGRFRLLVGFYEDLGPESGADRFPRLPAVDGGGRRSADNRIILPVELAIPG